MKTIIRRAVIVAALATLAAGCGATVKDVCDDLEEQCPDLIYGQCVEEGEALSQSADARGCADTFSAYLDCTASAGCSWATTCSAQKQALEACTGPFPQ